jgi:anti-sigma factor RsiW
MSAPCPGELLTALVDGALSHDERDRVHAHLAGCQTCRGEVDEQRRLKRRLALLAETSPPPPEALVGALRRLAVPGADPLSGPAAGRPPGAPRVRRERPLGARRPAVGPAVSRPRRWRRASAIGGAVGGGLVAVGVTALLLGGVGTSSPAVVDPGSDAFVVDFVSTTSEVPLADPAGAAPSLPRR